VLYCLFIISHESSVRGGFPGDSLKRLLTNLR
jgi:hypothetical protein